MDEKLVKECLRMFEERCKYYDALPSFTEKELACAYSNAATMLEYAINGNAECLTQFDTYGEGA